MAFDRRSVWVALAAVWLLSSGFVVCPEYVGAGARVPNPGRFEAIIGYPSQCVSGIPCYQYAKGTRSPVGSYPVAWYLHVGGQRVHDAQRPWLYVMNPQSGWAQHVAQTCAKQCFVDGVGASGLSRMKPRPAMTQTEWEQKVSAIIQAVTRAGKHALPNSVNQYSRSIISAAGGEGSTEAFTASNAKQLLGLGRIWVTERGGCAAKYAAYRRYHGAGDRFGCFEPPAKPWNLGWL